MPWSIRTSAPAIVWPASLAAALCACTTVGPNFRTPRAPASPGYAMAGDQVPVAAELTPETRAAGPWWLSLGSPSLDDVISQALAGNQTVAAADATLRKTLAELAIERGALAPQLDADASAQRERINIAAFGIAGFPNPTINLYSVGGTVAYDLDLFGGTRRRVEAAQAMAQSQARRADAAYLTLTGNVALQAVTIAQLRAKIAMVHAITLDDQRNIDIVNAAESAGGEARSASVSGNAQLAGDQALLPPLVQQLAGARHALAGLVGRSPAEWSAPDFAFEGFTPPARIPVSLPSSLVRSRPDILAAEATLHADTARIGVATANLYPDIRLVAGYSQTALTPGSLFSYGASGWNFGPQVTAPIFHGGRLKAEKRAAEAQAQVSLAQYRQTVLEAFVQVADVLTSLAADDERLAALTRAETQAQASLDDARAAYRLGGGASLAVLDAQRQLDRARLNRIDAEGQRLADMVNLYAATATDWRTAPGVSSGS
jgi:NodT family efflux transporter outer membrane factor (OMF) lipoprotein